MRAYFKISYPAGAAIEAFRLVKPGATGREVVTATGGDVPIMGGLDNGRGVNAGQVADVNRGGLFDVEYGDVVPRGAPVTADAQGRAVVAQSGDWFVGFADEAGAVGEVRPVFFSPGRAA